MSHRNARWPSVLRGLHEVSAFLVAASLPLATAPKDALAAFAVTIWLLRLPVIWRDMLGALRSPIMWTLAAYALVHAASVRWSLNPSEGAEELRSLRYLLLPVVLWPTLRRPWPLALGLMVGVGGLVILQVMQELEWFGWRPSYGGRLGGRLRPPMAGLFCAVGLLLALAVIRDGSWRRTWPAMVLVPAAGYGLSASGGRAAWIAAAVGIAVLGVASVSRWALAGGEGRRRRRGLALLGGVVLAAGMGWGLGGDMVVARVDQVRADVERARAGDYDSDNGFRVVAALTAIQMFRERPIHGWGAGSFRPYADETDHAEVLRRGWHPHSVPLHVASEQGLLGLLPMLGLVAGAGVAAWRSGHRHPAAGAGLAGLVAFGAATQFDAWHVAGQTCALAMVLLMLVLRAADGESDPSSDDAASGVPSGAGA